MSSIDRLVVTDGHFLGVRKELSGVFLLDTILQGRGDTYTRLELPIPDVSKMFMVCLHSKRLFDVVLFIFNKLFFANDFVRLPTVNVLPGKLAISFSYML